MKPLQQNTLVVELVTEELPPLALPVLGQRFGELIHQKLQHYRLSSADHSMRWFASPRRLAVQLEQVFVQAPEQQVTEKIMPVRVAFNTDGSASMALQKKLQSKGLDQSVIDRFERRSDGKEDVLFYTRTERGATLAVVLAPLVEEVLKALPIPKMMRWGDLTVQFARPVHKLLMLHGDDVLPGEVLQLPAGRLTDGHRFMSRGEIEVASAQAYEATLRAEGKVIADFNERQQEIERQLCAAAERENASLGHYHALLAEVTALVEYPSVYIGEFPETFLSVPQECLILTMQANQKYFPLFNDSGKLLNKFLIVSNIHAADPSNIVTGNQRVVRARLSDAQFFFEQDRKKGLVTMAAQLSHVVYHNQLGSQAQRVERIARLAGDIAQHLDADRVAAVTAAQLCKADLPSDMVGEFPELQGVMGRYYGLAEGQSALIADAIEQHYWPRFAGDALPQTAVAAAVALADKLDALVGFFGLGLVPTGDRDPFALRRAALGVLRILAEKQLPLDLTTLIDLAQQQFTAAVLSHDVAETLLDFSFDRLRYLYRDQGHYSTEQVEAVLALRPTRIDLIERKLMAVAAFQQLPEAVALAGINKRIANILKKNAAGVSLAIPQVALFQHPAEETLFAQVNQIAPLVNEALHSHHYTHALTALAVLQSPVDQFFEQVMVMVDDEAVRINRLSLLNHLAALMNEVADLSRL